jgi:tetratricopeptide (TPR) repeat protein
MIRKMMMLTFVALIASSSFGGYIEERKEAVELAKGDKEKAMAAFIKMAEGNYTDFQKSDALEQAALCASALKQYDRAMELAAKIPLEPYSKTCLMGLMRNNNKQAEVAEKFKDEKIDTWPDSVKGEAYYNRGAAFQAAKNGEAAEKDLAQAVIYSPDSRVKDKALNALASTYAGLLKNDDKAVETYRKLYDLGDLARQAGAVNAIANIFIKQAKFDLAIQELNRVDLSKLPDPYRRGLMLCAMGDALSGAGRKDEAAAKYKEAMQVQNVPESVKKTCEQKISELNATAK